MPILTLSLLIVNKNLQLTMLILLDAMKNILGIGDSGTVGYCKLLLEMV